jgi:hypothetical protein
MSRMPFAALTIVLVTMGCGSSGGGGGTGGSGGSSASGTGGTSAGSGGSTGSGGSGGAATGAGGATTGAGGATTGAGGGGVDAGLSACGDSTEPSSGDSCNTLDATGPCVTPTIGTGTPPAPAGGTIQPGTYELTSRTVYPTDDGGSTGDSARRNTLVISAAAGGAFTVMIAEASGTSMRRQVGTAVPTGTQIVFTPSCPPPGSGNNGGTVGYTATSTTFRIIETEGSSLRVQNFTKR